MTRTCKESAAHFHAMLLDDDWTERGKAAIHREIGDSYRYAGEWDLAERAYRDARSRWGARTSTRFTWRSVCSTVSTSRMPLGDQYTVARETLQRHEFEDFVFAYAAIAIWSGKSERLTEAKSLLQKCSKRRNPPFNERRLNLLVRVTGTLASGKASTEAKSDSTPEGGLATVSNFFLLQPNIAGIGININAIINYFAR